MKHLMPLQSWYQQLFSCNVWVNIIGLVHFLYHLHWMNKPLHFLYKYLPGKSSAASSPSNFEAISLITRELLNMAYGNHWIGIAWPNGWPAISLDCNLLDYSDTLNIYTLYITNRKVKFIITYYFKFLNSFLDPILSWNMQQLLGELKLITQYDLLLFIWCIVKVVNKRCHLNSRRMRLSCSKYIFSITICSFLCYSERIEFIGILIISIPSGKSPHALNACS